MSHTVCYMAYNKPMLISFIIAVIIALCAVLFFILAGIQEDFEGRTMRIALMCFALAVIAFIICLCFGIASVAMMTCK